MAIERCAQVGCPSQELEEVLDGQREKERKEGGEDRKLELIGAHPETRSIELQKQARKVISIKVLETVARE